MAPGLIIVMSMISLIIVSHLKTTFKDEETAWFIAINIRWMIIIGSIISITIAMIVSSVSIKEPFSLAGTGTESITFLGINKSKLMLCSVLGILCNILLLGLMEWFTSHGCSPVRNMSLSSVPRITSMHIIYSQYLGGLAGFVPLFILAFSLSLALVIAGYAGALFFTAGFLSIVMILMPILFVGAASTDSYRLSCFVSM